MPRLKPSLRMQLTASSSVPVKQYNRVGGNWSLYVSNVLITALLGEP